MFSFCVLRDLCGEKLCPPASCRTPPLRAMMSRMKQVLFALLAITASAAQSSPLSTQVESVFPDAQALYLDLHQHPELSSHETRPAAELAGRLPPLAYQVTQHIPSTPPSSTPPKH